MSTRTVVLEGGIGSGKSTLLQQLKMKYPFADCIEEYISEDEGMRMFEAYKRGTVCEAAFQWYILYYWDRIMKESHSPLRFVERGPVAGYAFTRSDEFGSQENWNSFVCMMQRILEKHHFEKFTFIALPHHCSVNVIEQYLNEVPGNIIFFIMSTAKEMKEGVCIRDRKGEERLSMKYLEDIQQNLLDLYKMSSPFHYLIVN